MIKLPPIKTIVPGLSRPETGVMVFGDDWPGIFIRGDDALGAAITIAPALARLESQKDDFDLTLMFATGYLKGHLDLLWSCKKP